MDVPWKNKKDGQGPQVAPFTLGSKNVSMFQNWLIKLAKEFGKDFLKLQWGQTLFVKYLQSQGNNCLKGLKRFFNVSGSIRLVIEKRTRQDFLKSESEQAAGHAGDHIIRQFILGNSRHFDYISCNLLLVNDVKFYIQYFCVWSTSIIAIERVLWNVAQMFTTLRLFAEGIFSHNSRSRSHLKVECWVRFFFSCQHYSSFALSETVIKLGSTGYHTDPMSRRYGAVSHLTVKGTVKKVKRLNLGFCASSLSPRECSWKIGSFFLNKISVYDK